jgi:steroid delta-isomerase-like uncharacterized protein
MGRIACVLSSLRLGFGVGLALVLGPALGLAGCGGEEVKPPASPVAPVPTEAPPALAATVEPAPAKEEPKAPPSLAELQRKVAMGLGEALNAHDATKAAAFYAERAVVTMPGLPDTTGRAAIAAELQTRFAAMSDSKSMATRVFVKGDVVVVEWAWSATHTGQLMGVKATGKPVGAMGVDVMWFTPEGLIKEQHTYTDLGTVMAQIGASKQKGRAAPTVPSAMPTVAVSTGSADEAKNVEAATKRFEAFEKKSEAAFLGSSSDDLTWDDLTQPEAMKGKAAGKRYFVELTRAFPDVKATTTNAWGFGDYVIAEVTLSGTQRAAFFGVPPTNKAIRLHALDILQFKDGAIVKGWSYGNGREMTPPPQPVAGPAASTKP